MPPQTVVVNAKEDVELALTALAPARLEGIERKADGCPIRGGK